MLQPYRYPKLLRSCARSCVVRSVARSPAFEHLHPPLPCLRFSTVGDCFLLFLRVCRISEFPLVVTSSSTKSYSLSRFHYWLHKRLTGYVAPVICHLCNSSLKSKVFLLLKICFCGCLLEETQSLSRNNDSFTIQYRMVSSQQVQILYLNLIIVWV